VAHSATNQCNNRALKQELLHQSPPTGSQCNPGGDFSLPTDGSRQKKIGHVRASDQQHASHRNKKQQKRWPDVLNSCGFQRHQHGAKIFSIGPLVPNALHDHCHFR
jgi:hypothetical protein